MVFKVFKYEWFYYFTSLCVFHTHTHTYSIVTWNRLKEEVIMAKNVHQLKEKLDKYIYGDKTTPV